MQNTGMTMVPVGGLANRMRAAASAVTLMRKCGGTTRLVWYCDKALNAPFASLFEPITEPGVTLLEGNAANGLLYDRPRRRNFWLPRVFQQLRFDFRLYENHVEECFGENPALERAVMGRTTYAAAFYQLCGYDNALLRRLFRPVPAIEAEVRRRMAAFSPFTIGIHIRRGDNVVAAQRSPLALFFEVIDKETAAHPELHVYLATDSEEVKQQLRARYGERISTASSAADRGSIAGIRDGIADMLTLSRTKKIYGSSGSSFSELAAQMGDVELVLCRKKQD